VLLANVQPSEAMDHDRPTLATGWATAGHAPCRSWPTPSSAVASNSARHRGPSLIPEHGVASTAGCKPQWCGPHSLVVATGRLYPGMCDVAADPTVVSAHFDGHVEVVEFDGMRVPLEGAGPDQIQAVIDRTHELFEIGAEVEESHLVWAAQVAVGLEQIVEDFGLDSLAHYHRRSMAKSTNGSVPA
jgi:L-arabinose isomerase